MPVTEPGDGEQTTSDDAVAPSPVDPVGAHERSAAATSGIASFPPPDPATAYQPSPLPAAGAVIPGVLPSPVTTAAYTAPASPTWSAPSHVTASGTEVPGHAGYAPQGHATSQHAQSLSAPPQQGDAQYPQPLYPHSQYPQPLYSQPLYPQPQYAAYGSGQYAYGQNGYQPYGYGSTPAPRRSGRTAAIVLGALAAITALVVGAAVVVPRVLPGGDARRTAAGSGSTPGQVVGSGGREVTDPATRAAAVDRMLAARGSSVTRDAASAWNRTQIRNATAPAFSRLAALPITVWRYEVVSLDAAGTESDVNLVVRVHMRYDIDTHDAIVREKVTLRHGAAGWQVATETNESPRLQPWDLGTLSVVHGKRSLVIGIDQRATVLRRYASIADSVTPDVAAIWGKDWNQHPVLIVPKSVGQLGRALDQTEKFLTDFAAVTTGESGAAPPDKTAYRVWTNTPGLSDVGELGREIILRHEITHVATGAPQTPSVPLWLEEGFAEYVGYSTTNVPQRTAWTELVTAVRKGTEPTSLPDEDAFHAGAIDLAYESSDLACRLVAEKYGQAALVRLYRLVRAGTGSEAENLESALTAVTGYGTTAFVKIWRARMAGLS